ncbi:hypothetical protein EON64_11300 [archaeon]|nr:MAG: hypothetical protein EON64_11300 [archaeon]
MAEEEQRKSEDAGSYDVSQSILNSCEVMGKQALLGFGVGSLLGMLQTKNDAAAEEGKNY